MIGSDPIDGSTVATVPRVVRIFFASAVSPTSIAYVFTPDERMVDAAHSTISGKDARELDTLLSRPDQLPQGSYTVRWTALASSDGHTVSGTASVQQQFGQHLNLQLGYTRLHQNYSTVAVLASIPNTNREFVSISYQFSRPLGR